MLEADLDDLTAEIFRRVLRMRSSLDEEEFDDLASEIMMSMGAAAMRKAEARARSGCRIFEGWSHPNVIRFPGPRHDGCRNGIGDPATEGW